MSLLTFFLVLRTFLLVTFFLAFVFFLGFDFVFRLGLAADLRLLEDLLGGDLWRLRGARSYSSSLLESYSESYSSVLYSE